MKCGECGKQLWPDEVDNDPMFPPGIKLGAEWCHLDNFCLTHAANGAAIEEKLGVKNGKWTKRFAVLIEDRGEGEERIRSFFEKYGPVFRRPVSSPEC